MVDERAWLLLLAALAACHDGSSTAYDYPEYSEGHPCFGGSNCTMYDADSDAPDTDDTGDWEFCGFCNG